MPEVEDAVERVAAILKRQRRERYEQEAVAGSGDLVDHEDAREIVAALQSSQPRAASYIDAEIANGSMWSVFQRKKPPIEQENTEEDLIAENANNSPAEAQPRSPVEDAPVERLGEALFALSDKLRASGILSASDAVHTAYENVVAAFEVLSKSPAIDPRVEELRGALETCAKTFRRYGEIHRQKGTKEGDLKAANNDDLAEFCESVLADTALAAFGGKTE